MPIPPIEVIYPQNRIRRVIEVLHDGTQTNPTAFSLAKLEFVDGGLGYGIRHNINEWNENNPDLGYPTCRPGNPTWFILPDLKELSMVLNAVAKNL